MHQKRIIDDILTLSKLDSKLLQLSAQASAPVKLVRSIIKIFDRELKRADIKLDFVEEDSVQDLKLTWNLLDPSRVIQILINLMTNAIKFTRTEKVRRIAITVGASLTRPTNNKYGVAFVQPNTQIGDMDRMAGKEWGNGEVVYISVAVKDSGGGLDDKEVGTLFNLFRQASPKTYTQYGGSGLGLFISRQLVEMHGGLIGVSSPGKVCCFLVRYCRKQWYWTTRLEL